MPHLSEGEVEIEVEVEVEVEIKDGIKYSRGLI